MAAITITTWIPLGVVLITRLDTSDFLSMVLKVLTEPEYNKVYVRRLRRRVGVGRGVVGKGWVGVQEPGLRSQTRRPQMSR